MRIGKVKGWRGTFWMGMHCSSPFSFLLAVSFFTMHRFIPTSLHATCETRRAKATNQCLVVFHFKEPYTVLFRLGSHTWNQIGNKLIKESNTSKKRGRIHLVYTFWRTFGTWNRIHFLKLREGARDSEWEEKVERSLEKKKLSSEKRK